MELEIRQARRAEIAQLIDWAAVEGWNPGLADLDAFLAADPGGFFVGMRAERLICGLSIVRYGADFAFLGFYLCDPTERGKGYGLALWQAAMAQRSGMVIGLDGVLAQQANYQKSGFAFAHRNIRFAGPIDRARGIAMHDAVEAIGEADLAELIGFDARFFGAPRPAFLRAWLDPSSGRIVRVLRRKGRIFGYGVIRPCREGYKIGPLFAQDASSALILFDSLAAIAQAGPIILDVPEPNQTGLDLAAARGLIPVFETARMYRGPAPSLPLGEIFGITSFELG